MRLPKLLSLRILTGETYSGMFAGFFDVMLLLRDRSRQSRLLISEFFQTRRSLFIDLVSIRRDKDTMLLFLHITRVGPLGNCRSVAVEVDERETCYIEPAPEILDTDAQTGTFLRLGY